MYNIDVLNSNIQLCKQCELNSLQVNQKNTKNGTGKLYGWFGGDTADIMFVGMNPSYNRFENLEYAFGGKNFSEGTGVEFIKILKNAGVLERSYVTNLCKCSSNDNQIQQRFVNMCVIWLMEEVCIVRPKILFMLGNSVEKCITNNESITDFLILYNVKVVKIAHPNYVVSYHKSLTEKYTDEIRQAARIG